MENIFLAGEKIYLTPVEPNDAVFLTSSENDPDVRHALFLAFPVAREQQEEKIHTYTSSKDSIVFTIREKQTNKAIGQTAFFRLDFISRAAVFYLAILNKSCWSKGYGTEATRLMVNYAFKTLNLNRIQLHVCAENTPAIKIYQKLGFVKEGILRQAMFRDGHYVDFWVMGILKEDWINQSE